MNIMGRLLLQSLLVVILGLILSTFPTFTHAVDAAIKGRKEIVNDLLPHKQNGRVSCTTDDNAQLRGRNGLTNPFKLWKNTTFAYKVDPKLNNAKKMIKEVVNFFADQLRCVSFLYLDYGVSYSKPHVIFRSPTESVCNSWIGIHGNQQDINLGEGCVYNSVIAHEVLHALGFGHEHNRPDRDQYVIINTNNIKEGEQHNFDQLQMPEYSSFNVPYNYASVMHYSFKEFSKNDDYTILPSFVNSTFQKFLFKLWDHKRGEFGSVWDYTVKYEVRHYDLVKLRRMYGCCPKNRVIDPCQILVSDSKGKLTSNNWN